MYFDEVVHVSGNRAATVIIHPEKKQYHVFSKVIGTNNTVEYKSYIIGLKAALELKVEKLDVYKDSILYDK
jgi:ribonuclease HI